MTSSSPTYLVVVDEDPAFQVALRYASKAAQAAGIPVTLLYIVEPQGIETWGVVERALDDEAFDQARQVMAAHEKKAQELSGQKPLSVYRKGEKSAALMAYLEQVDHGVTLVLGVGQDNNPLIRALTSDKGLRKLPTPLIIVPEKV